MAFYSGVIAVGTAAVRLDGNFSGFHGGNPYRLYLRNNDASEICYIGGENVSIGNGYVLNHGESLALTVSAADALFVVGTKQNHEISWLSEPI